MKTDKGEGMGSLKERGVEESTIKRKHFPQRKRLKTHVLVSLSTVDVNQKINGSGGAFPRLESRRFTVSRPRSPLPLRNTVL